MVDQGMFTFFSDQVKNTLLLVSSILIITTQDFSMIDTSQVVTDNDILVVKSN